MIPTWFARPVRLFASLKLTAQYAVAGSIVMVLAALLTGIWVNSVIARGVITNTAGATALFMDSFIGPIAQELASSDVLSAEAVRAIKELRSRSGYGDRIVSIKIWKPGGLLAFAESPGLQGRRFPVSADLQAALSGEIVAEMDALDEAESQGERVLGMPLLEIYSPVRRIWSGEVIAVVEFYEDASELTRTLTAARVQTWAVVAALTFVTSLSLLGIVHGGSRIIDRQRKTLHKQMADARHAAEANRLLRLRVQGASARAAELNEHFLRRVGADLHDGPAQLISLAALRLGAVASRSKKAERLKELEVVRDALNAAMREIRQVSSGLSLPEISDKPMAEVIRMAALAHERLSGSPVATELSELPVQATPAVKIAAYRFVQEGLSNAFRHAPGTVPTVLAACQSECISLKVENPSLPRSSAVPDRSEQGLGLAGLRERIESLGGIFAFSNEPGRTTELAMSLSLFAEEPRA